MDFQWYLHFVNRVLEEQSEALRKRKVEQLSQKIDIIMAGKKQKLLSKGVTGKAELILVMKEIRSFKAYKNDSKPFYTSLL